MEEYCIYLRKSRADAEAEKAGQGETLARHEHILRQIAERDNLQVTKIYREIISGDSIAARPEMQQLLQDMEKGMYSGVLVMEVERLARGNTIDQGIVAQVFKNTETKIITPIKIYDPNNEFDEEYFEFSLFMSRREYKTIKRRMQAGREASVREGNYIGTVPPYGYKKISPAPKVRTLEIDDEEAKAVRMIFDMYLNSKIGAKAIAARLNAMHIKPRKSYCWEAVSIRKILKNPVYAGKIRWHTQKGSEIIAEGRHKAIIPYDIFYSVQERIAGNFIPSVKANTELKNHYHGILFCRNCGSQLRRRPAQNRDCYMFCPKKECRGKTVSSPVEFIDEAVITAVKLRLTEMGLENFVYTGGNEISELDPDRKKLAEKSFKMLKKQKDSLYTLLETGVYTTEIFEERRKKLNQQEQLLLLECENNNREEKFARKDEESFSLEQVIDRFKSASAAERNDFLRKIIRRINYGKTIPMCKNNAHSDMHLEIIFL